jgi:diaminopimelate dehydrogenase
MNSSMQKINVGVVGYGPLGKSCVEQIKLRKHEFKLVETFSRRATMRDPLNDEFLVPVYKIGDYANKLDVVLFCNDQINDLRDSSVHKPFFVPLINEKGISTVDGYNNKGEMRNENYQNAVRHVTNKSGTTAIYGAGWIGYLSINKLLQRAMLPAAAINDFYGATPTGTYSLVHTNIVKQIKGVHDAYVKTTMDSTAQEGALNGILVPESERQNLYVSVICKQEDFEFIKDEIVNTPYYFANQKVHVTLANKRSLASLYKNNSKYDADLITVNKGTNAHVRVKFSMEDNPSAKAGAMLAYAKANVKMQQNNQRGVYHVADVPPSCLLSKEEFFANL